MSNESRTSMVRSAASLISTRGVSATSFSDVLADSGAPRGSIYHHFPDGKKQLAADAVRWTAERVRDHQRRCPATSAEEILNWFVAMWRGVVVGSHGAAGCAIAGVALDSPADEELLLGVVREAFTSWTDLLTEQLSAVGLPSERAASLAVTVLAGMEGALILCRAEGGPGPLEAVAAELLRAVAG